MAEKIQNGNFSNGVESWENGVNGENAYTWEPNWITGVSQSVNGTPYAIRQGFSVLNSVGQAKITVYAEWNCPSGDYSHGSVNFVVKLKKPSGTFVTLIDVTKTNQVGGADLLNNSDITPYFDEVGTYYLYLYMDCYSADRILEDAESQGWYDNISLTVIEVVKKVVSETIGSGEGKKKKVDINKLSPLSLLEMISTRSFLCKSINENISIFEYYSYKIIKIITECLSLPNWLKSTEQQLSEGLGLNESYFIFYKPSPLFDKLGLQEGLMAKKISGNLETVYLFGDYTEWDKREPVDTDWIITRRWK